jgi:hypothetical protein
MLGIRLREHHQLDVGRIAPCGRECIDQVIDLVFGQCQAEIDVRTHQGSAATALQIDVRERLRRMLPEQIRGGIEIRQDRLGHPVVDHRIERRELLRGQCDAVGDKVKRGAPLDALDRVEGALAQDVASLRRPGRHCAKPGHHQPHLAVLGGCLPPTLLG